MRIFRVSRALLRDLLVPLLCALIALSGIAQARAHGNKTNAAGTAGYFVLCTQTNAAGGDEPAPDHDYSDCCLPRLTAIPGAQPVLSFQMRVGVVAVPETAPRVSSPVATGVPWSRGPPGAA